VSIADDIKGIFKEIDEVNSVLRLTVFGSTVECAGTRRTSSNVKASSAMRNIRFPHINKNAIIQMSTAHVHMQLQRV